MWARLRREVEERPGDVRVAARVRRERLDMVVRIVGPCLVSAASPEGGADGGGGWVPAEFAYPVLGAVRQLLQFGTDVEVLGPPEARTELARAAAGVHALYRGC